MSWTVLHIIGIIAYAVSGAIIAIEAKYSLVGVFVLGLATSFGGAVIRNLIIGLPITFLWDRFTIFIVFLTLTVIVLIPMKWVQHWKKWGLFFDSIGLASFAIQGALSAQEVRDQLGVIVLASMFTGVGGGMIRDLLAGRQPLALKEDIHAVLTMLCAGCVWLGWTNPIQLTVVVCIVAAVRMFAIQYDWRLRAPFSVKLKSNDKN